MLRLHYLLGMAKKQNGFTASLERIRAQKRAAHRLDRTTVQVGWIDGAMTLNNRAPFAVIARTLCYGREEGMTSKGWKYPAIPARNFVKAYEKFGYEKKALPIASKCLADIFRNGSEYKADMAKQLAPFGAKAEGQLKLAILKENYKKNAWATVREWARRHSGTSSNLTRIDKKELVDTGAMVQHITTAVTTK